MYNYKQTNKTKLLNGQQMRPTQRIITISPQRFNTVTFNHIQANPLRLHLHTQGHVHNENMFTPRISISPNTKNSMVRNNRRHSYQVQTNRDSKLISKDFLKPSSKPNFANPSNQTKHKNLNNNQKGLLRYDPCGLSTNINDYDLPETLKMINEKLRELKLCQSLEPIVQPYRDRSLDGYDYSQGYGFTDRINEENSEKNNEIKGFYEFDRLKNMGQKQEERKKQVWSEDFQNKFNQMRKGFKNNEEQIYINYIANPKQKYIKSQIYPINEQRQQHDEQDVFNINNQKRISLIQPQSYFRAEFPLYSSRNSPHSITINQAQQGQDKWDRILRERQLQYQRAISRHSSGDQSFIQVKLNQQETALNTAIKHNNPDSINQIRYSSGISYQSYQSKSRQKQYYLEQNIHNLYLSECNKGVKKGNGSMSQDSPNAKNNYYDKIQLTQNQQCMEKTNFYDQSIKRVQRGINQLNNQKTDEQGLKPKLNEMKYSYNFSETQEIQYRVEKQLFSKLLEAKGVQWMLTFNTMVQYVQSKYNFNTNTPIFSKNHNHQASQFENNENFVTFVKIGDDGDSIFHNRVIAHYIGVWLLSMGFDDSQIRERIIGNIQLMFMDVDQVIQQDLDNSKLENVNESQDKDGENLRQIAELMFNNLLYGYLPGDLQLEALLQVCKRGWQFLTFLICRILKALIRLNKRKQKIPKLRSKGQKEIESITIYQKLEKALKGSL